MPSIGDVVNFVATKSALELLALFWYFVIFDFTRYVVFDGVVLAVYALTRRRMSREMAEARRRLYHEKPLVTVIAVGRNEGRHIPKFGESLRRQTYKNLEIIVVDDGSTDDTPQICRRLEQERVIHKFFRNSVRGGKASAANLALRYATGKFIVHMDADSHLRFDSIEKVVTPFYWREDIGSVAGDLRVANVGSSLATRLQSIEYIKALSVGRTVNSMLGIIRIVSGAYGAFRRDILEKVGGWDVGPGLDGDLTAKIRKLHCRVHFEPQAVCFTNVPTTFTALARQRYRWDRSLVRFRLRKHADFFRPDRNFSWLNFLSSSENLFFNLVLDFKWWIYIAQIVFLYTEFLGYILVINALLYFLANTVEWLIGLTLLRGTLRRKEYWNVFFLPLKPIYSGFYLRAVRTYAYAMELIFKTSYVDAWNPWKSSRAAEREGL